MYEVVYEAMWGRLTRYSFITRATSVRQAEIKFYCSDEGDNCANILSISRVR